MRQGWHETVVVSKMPTTRHEIHLKSQTKIPGQLHCRENREGIMTESAFGVKDSPRKDSTKYFSPVGTPSQDGGATRRKN
jgi:hypothetical protein